MPKATKAASRPKAKARGATSPSSSGPRRGARKPLVGNQTPRLFTPPRASSCDAFGRIREDATLGYEVVEFWDWMRDRLEELDANRGPDDDTEYLDLLPRALEWQRWLLVHALELAESGDRFRFRTVLLLVARQNGKSTLLTVLILWRLFQDAAKMVLETHMSLDHAKEAWLDAVAVAEAIPELADEIAKTNTGKGSELLKLDGGEKFKIATANRRGGRGFRGDLVIFDELREHTDWDAWSATSKTTLARKRAQVWGVSNAGDLSSVVLRHLRMIALSLITGETPHGVPEEVLEAVGDSIALFEWSAGTTNGREDGPLRPIWDREGWQQANPSMGLSQLDEAAIAASMADPEWEVRTEVLCQFINTSGTGPFPAGTWQATTDTVGERGARGVTRDTARPFAYGIDMSQNGSKVYIAVAFWDSEGRVRFQLAAESHGPDWVVPWLTSPERKVPPRLITMQTRGAPIASLHDELERAKLPDGSPLKITPWQDADLAGWHMQFYNRVRTSVADDGGLVTITHGPQPPLDMAANTAVVKAMAGGWVIDRKASPVDPAGLIAAIGAVGLLLENPDPPKRSVYETHDLMVV